MVVAHGVALPSIKNPVACHRGMGYRMAAPILYHTGPLLLTRIHPKITISGWIEDGNPACRR
jgi:hypothetical protein